MSLIFFCILDEAPTDEEVSYYGGGDSPLTWRWPDVDLRLLTVHCWLGFGLTISWRFYVNLSLMQRWPDRCWEYYESSLLLWWGKTIWKPGLFQIFGGRKLRYPGFQDYLREGFYFRSSLKYSQRGIVQFPAVYSSTPLSPIRMAQSIIFLILCHSYGGRQGEGGGCWTTFGLELFYLIGVENNIRVISPL